MFAAALVVVTGSDSRTGTENRVPVFFMLMANIKKEHPKERKQTRA